MKRVLIKLFGQVQGVNLRATIKLIAVSLDLKGYVINKEDGSVEIVAEGNEDNLKELIRRLNNQEGPGSIEKLEDYWSESSKEFNDFVMKY